MTLNGNSKTYAAWVGVALLVGGLIVAIVIAIVTKADLRDLENANNRITVVETHAIHQARALERIEAKLERIETELKRGQ